MKRSPPLSSNIADVHHSLGVVCIDVEDGGVDHTGHVRGIGRRAGHTRVSCEANLLKQHKLVKG